MPARSTDARTRDRRADARSAHGVGSRVGGRGLGRNEDQIGSRGRDQHHQHQRAAAGARTAVPRPVILPSVRAETGASVDARVRLDAAIRTWGGGAGAREEGGRGTREAEAEAAEPTELARAGATWARGGGAVVSVREWATVRVEEIGTRSNARMMGRSIRRSRVAASRATWRTRCGGTSTTIAARDEAGARRRMSDTLDLLPRIRGREVGNRGRTRRACCRDRARRATPAPFRISASPAPVTATSLAKTATIARKMPPSRPRARRTRKRFEAS